MADRLTPSKKLELRGEFAPEADELIVCKSGHSNHRYGGSFSSHTKFWNYRLIDGNFVLVASGQHTRA